MHIGDSIFQLFVIRDAGFAYRRSGFVCLFRQKTQSAIKSN